MTEPPDATSPATTLCIVAHPDDAEIGAGATLAKLAGAGTRVVVLCLTTSEWQESLAGLRRAAAEASARHLGFEVRWLAEGRYHQVEQVPQFELVRQIDACIAEVRPDVVFTHPDHDSHHDHVLTHQAVLASSRRWPASLLAYPPADRRSAAYTRFVPNVFVDVERTIERKLEALRMFEYPGQGFRSLETEATRLQAQYFGSLCGLRVAEAFQLLRTRTMF